MDSIREFEAAASNALGVEVRVEEAGKFQRFSTNGKSSDKSGWLVFNGDHGAYGDWRADIRGTWVAKGAGNIAKRVRDTERLSAANAERHKWDEAAARAAEIWGKGQEVPYNDEEGGHPYLRRKMVEPHGLRQLDGALLVPMRDDGGKLWSLQYIFADGTKRFMRGGRVSGTFHIIQGDQPGIGICEGYATGAAVHKMRGCSVYVAFNAGNLERVTTAAAAMNPEADLIIWGDDDRQTAGNPGKSKAAAVAISIRRKLEIRFPDFSRFEPHSHPNPTDWNDYLLMEEGEWQI